MEPQPKKSMVVPYIMMIVISALIFGGGGYYLGRISNSAPPYVLKSDSSASRKALEEAKQYQPPAGTMCTQALTPAIHKETGAEYTFPTGCLPPGWAR